MTECDVLEGILTSNYREVWRRAIVLRVTQIERELRMDDPLVNSHTAPKFAAVNPGKMAEWYVENLGFPKSAIFESGDYAIVRRGDLTLHFWKCSDPTIAENTSCYVELRDVAALNALHAIFLENSKEDSFAPGRVQIEPVDAHGHGMREFHVWDPDGNLIGFGASI